MQLLNWLYVQDEARSLQLDHDAIRIRGGDGASFTIPLLSLEGIVCFGVVEVTTPLIHRCAEDGRPIVYLTRTGRFKARTQGPCTGNVLLRVAQYRTAADPMATREIARSIVAGKVRASRTVVLRAAREAVTGADRSQFETANEELSRLLPMIRVAASIDEVRGYEGEAASVYFRVFPRMLRVQAEYFSFDRRLKHPPRDRVNALLSFLYTMLRIEVAAALETTGLDPQVGFLHTLRPGRPALALDLLEEMRAPVADRLAASLINRHQLQAEDFAVGPGGSFALTDHGRSVVLAAYRGRKIEEVQHPLLLQRLPWGLIPHAQARILARHLRGDLPVYIPFTAR